MRRIFAVLGFCLLLAGCQSYERLPLDEAAHKREWQARSADSQSVRDFARELAARDASPRGTYNPLDGVDLAEAEAIALFFNADLRKARLDAGASLANAQNAGAWDNPELNISGGMILASISNPWKAAAAIEFTIPLSGRKGVEKDLAFAEHSVTWREIMSREWQVLLELRRLWREHGATLERAALLRAHLAQVEETGKRAEDLTNAGELGRTDARVFAIELTLRRIELAELERHSQEQQIALKGLLGLIPDAPLTFTPTLAVVQPPAAGERESKALKHSPEIALARAQYEVAEQQLRLEIRKQYPDLRLGPGFDVDEGQSTISLGFGIPIPIINLNKQGIAHARAARLASRAAFEAECEKLTVALALAQARLVRVRAARDSIETDLAPLVDLQVKEARERAALGDFDALLMLEAFKTQFEAKERVIEARLQEALAIDEINGRLGPTFKPQPTEGK